jgi:eukaryotic-like serine/threonine-protein kinase
MKFGQYELLEPIAIGGMAEVFKGRVVAAEGFEKFVAIKRILPDLAEDERFVKMLLTEARIHSALSHRNIVQIHDLGISEDGQYFIVLEFVEGYDLRIISEQLTAEGEIIPEALSLHIASEIAQGLQFAHELRDPDGLPLGLIHRDVTPSNILISFAGEVKLSDFGLAKRRHDRSVVGSLKGNLSYMSPEQAMQGPLDRRTDVFSLGAVLFELLTGRRLREITNEVAAFSHVASGVVPSARQIRPDLPVAIERLLDRALAADPAQRFPDAAAFGTAIREVLGQMNVPVGASDLGALLGLVNPPRRPRLLMLERSRVIRLGPEAQALRDAYAAAATPAPLTSPGMTPAAPSGGRGMTPAAPSGGRASGLRPAVAAPAGPRATGASAAAGADAATPAIDSDPMATPPPTAPLPPLRPRGRTPRPPGPAERRPSAAPASARTTGQRPAVPQPAPMGATPALGTQRPPMGPSPAHGTRRPPMGATPALGTQRPPMGATPAHGTRRPPMGATPALGTQRPPMGPGPAYEGARPPPSQTRPFGIQQPIRGPGAGLRPQPLPGTPAHGTRRPEMGATPAFGIQRPAGPPAQARQAPFGGPVGVPANFGLSRVQRETARVQLRSRRPWRSVLLVLLLLLGGGVAAVHRFLIPVDVLLVWLKPAWIAIATEPAGATLRLDGVTLHATSPTAVSVKRDLADHVIEATLAGYRPARAVARYEKSVGPTFLLRLEKDPSFVAPSAPIIPGASAPGASAPGASAPGVSAPGASADPSLPAPPSPAVGARPR